MLGDDGIARVSILTDRSGKHEDPFLAAVQRAAAADFAVLGEIGHGSDGVIVYLARELLSSRLVALRLQRDGELANEFTLEVVRHLDTSMPAPESKCPQCGKPIRGWARYCSFCGVDLSGAVPTDDDTGGHATLLAALDEAVAADYEVFGEMSRSEGGGAVYFARDRQTNRIIALRLQREGAGDDFSVGVTSALKSLAASLGVKPVATRVLGALVSPTIPPPPRVSAVAEPPLAPQPPPPPRRSLSRRTHLMLGGGGVLLVVAVVMLMLPDQKPEPTDPPLLRPLPDTARTVQTGTVDTHSVAIAPTPVVPSATPPLSPSANSPTAAPPPAPRIKRGTIKVIGLAADAEIHIDGRLWSPSTQMTGLVAGPHVIAVFVAGYVPLTDTVRLGLGQNLEWSPKLTVQPRVAPAPVVPPPPPPPPPDLPAKTAKESSPPAAEASTACERLMQAHQWTQAVEQCSLGAQSGNPAAERNLGELYDDGHGVHRSWSDAVRWFRASVAGGDSVAMYLLGTEYESGVGGLPHDVAAALQWYTKSAEGGYAQAQYTLGSTYEKGRFGVAKDRTTAIEWYRKAAGQNYKDAARKVADLSKP